MASRLFTRVMLYAIISVAIPLVAYITDLLYFQTNDDFTQMLITSGILYGSPSSQLLYVAKPLSAFLAFMYSLSLNYSWYTIILLATQGLAIFAYLLLFDEIWRVKNIRKKLLGALILASPILIFMTLFYALQYTQTAMMAAGAGTLLILFSKNVYHKFLAILLIALGIFWRAEAGLIAVALVVSFFILNFFIDRNFSKDKIKYRELLLLSLTVFFSYSIFLAGSHVNSPFISKDKKVALSYYQSLGRVLDYQPTQTTRNELHENARKVGWTKNDFRLLNYKFYFANQDIYTEDRNLKLADITAPASQIRFIYEVTQNLNDILLSNHKRSIAFLLLFFALSFLIFRREKFLYIFAYLGILYVLFTVILSMGRIPERIIWPVTFVALISLGIILLNSNSIYDEDRPQKKFFSFTTPFLVGFFYILISFNLYDQYLKVDQELWWKSAKEDRIFGFERVLEYKPDKPIIAFSSFYSVLLKTHSPTKPPSQTEDIWKNMILIGWTIRSPEMDHKLKNLNINQDLFTSLANQQAYLATSDHIVEIQYLKRYFRQHEYINVRWPEGPFVYNETGLGIWKIDSFEPIELGE